MKREIKPIAIVGAGTSGSVLALLLAKKGIKSILIDKSGSIDTHPRGHVWSIRSMEVLRSIDPELADEMREISPAPLKLRYITWCTALNGVELGRCVPIGNDPEYTAHLLGSSACRPLHLSQNVSDEILRRWVLKNENIELKTGDELIDIQDNLETYVLKCRELKTNKVTEHNVRYLVGADGAESTVRRLLAIKTNEEILQHVAQIHFRADLNPLTSTRPSPLYWVMNPKVVGALTAHTKDEMDWVLTTAILPNIEDAGSMSENRAEELVREAIGESSTEIKLCGVRPWKMSLRKSETNIHGNIFLIGDAAAGFSAIGGFGLNHGIQDAAGLAWRLDLMHKQPAMNSALTKVLKNSFSVERGESFEFLSARTKQLSSLSDEVLQSAGLDPTGFHKLVELSNSTFLRYLPKEFKKKLFRFIQSTGLRALVDLQRETQTGKSKRTRVKAAIEKQREVFVTLGTDLGQEVTSGFVLNEPHPQPQPIHSPTEYLPTTSPGSLIPHIWSKSKENECSIRDVARASPLSLMVYGRDRSRWVYASKHIESVYGLEITCPVISEDPNSTFVIDSETWSKSMEIDPDGALIVRGDGVIVWRSRKKAMDPEATLLKVMQDLINKRI